MRVETFEHRQVVEALHVTPETAEADIAFFAPDYRVPAWMRQARGWLVRMPGLPITAKWVPPEKFEAEFSALLPPPLNPDQQAIADHFDILAPENS